MLSTSTLRIPTTATSITSTPQQASSIDAVTSNDDLLIHILLRLPVTSLLKFKSVSKYWLSIISSPRFSCLRNPYPNPTSGLFLRMSPAADPPDYKFVPFTGRPSTPPFFKSLSFIDSPSGIRIVQSCNGLLCCYSEYGRVYGCGLQSRPRFSKQKYYIFNPTTQKFTILPEVLHQDNRHPIVGVSLAFDPSKSLHYKVICVRSHNSVISYGYRIDIYSSESRSWRQSGVVFTAPGRKFYHGVFWNGAIHWISCWGTTRSDKFGSILSFDVTEERILEMPMPEIPHDWKQVRIRYFGESRNHLHLLLARGPGEAQFNVYEMEKDCSRWVLKYQVDLDAVTNAFTEIKPSILEPENLVCYNFSILCLAREENDEDSFLVMRITGKVICYSFEEKTFKKLCDLPSAFLGWQCVYPYIETLARVQ